MPYYPCGEFRQREKAGCDMNLRSIDLNLMVVLQALLAERSVTRAGTRLGLSQPATSAALARLRHMFRDPLLHRSRDEMLLTKKAEQLVAPLRAALEAMALALDAGGSFDPAAMARVFRLSMADAPALLLLPQLSSAVSATSPSSRIEMRPLDRDRVAEWMQGDEIDLAISVGLAPNRNLESETLFEDELVCIVRMGHPLLRRKRISWPALADYAWLDVSFARQVFRIEEAAAKHGIEIRIGAIVPHFLLVPPFVADSDHIGLIGRRPALHFADRLGVRVLPFPKPLRTVTYQMVWHKRYANQETHRWLRQRIREASDRLAQASPRVGRRSARDLPHR
jgi:LysR family transcriptional regulator, mexEF-oprN operon transcriptional activator